MQIAYWDSSEENRILFGRAFLSIAAFCWGQEVQRKILRILHEENSANTTEREEACRWRESLLGVLSNGKSLVDPAAASILAPRS